MRYIDPYQLADKVGESMRDNPHEGKLALNHRLEHEHFLRMIALAPSANVEPVVHARWIVEFDSEGLKKYSCSSCGYFRRTDIHVSLNWYYCPHCGAKMDEEEPKNE